MWIRPSLRAKTRSAPLGVQRRGPGRLGVEPPVAAFVEHAIGVRLEDRVADVEADLAAELARLEASLRERD